MDEEDDNNPIPVVTKTTQEKIKEAGINAVGEKEVTLTTIRIEFNVGHPKAAFHMRKALLDLLHRFSLADPNAYIKDRDTEMIWADKHSFPASKEFKEKFVLRQDVSEAGYVKMFMHMTMVHFLLFWTLKRHARVCLYLNQKNIWIHQDHFSTAVVCTPGFIGNLHPKLINLQKLYQGLEEGTRNAKSDHKEVPKKWKQANQTEDGNMMGSNRTPK
eukprot:8217508-Ditylum_brightwellii.AAC.1